VQIDFSRPGKPTDNAHVESFNGTLRAECLDVHWFATLIEGKSSSLGGENTMTVVLTDLWENERRVSSLVRSL
jgi:transposase InsO family protein